jgi:hypothetical protein
MSGFLPAVKYMTDTLSSLDAVRSAMQAQGVRLLYAKTLAANDNSKNQVYLGGDFSVINVLPTSEPVATTSGSHQRPIFTAAVAMSWMDGDGRVFPAPNSQLILYPQYPEVRLSGFLRGAEWAPNALMTTRVEGRILLLGVTDDRRVIAVVAAPDAPLAREVAALPRDETSGALFQVPLHATTGSSRTRLLAALCRISREGWIPGWRLNADGSRGACVAPNCVGVTLESELGITANGRAEPDFDGWEVKAHTVARLGSKAGGPVTLMTPEPTGGVYVADGVAAFLDRYGYVDRRGRIDRRNFGGVHRVGSVHRLTGLRLTLDGYDAVDRRITRSDGVLALVDAKGTVAASWNFTGLLAHWSRKHSKAVFVPAEKRTEPTVSFRYGADVLVAEGTDYTRVLHALATGTVYYDPGIKMEDVSGARTVKRRSQFRVSRHDLAALYHSSRTESACL